MSISWENPLNESVQNIYIRFISFQRLQFCVNRRRVWIEINFSFISNLNYFRMKTQKLNARRTSQRTSSMYCGTQTRNEQVLPKSKRPCSRAQTPAQTDVSTI